MNPSAHHPTTYELTPCVFSPPRTAAQQFILRMRYRPEGDFQTFIGVYVPQELEPTFRNGDVTTIHLETLEVNGLASRLLPGGPSYLILGVRLQNGEELSHVPQVLRAARLKRYILGVTACLLGISSLALGSVSWLGALGLVLGTHTLRTGRQLPARPFLVYNCYG